MKTDPETEITEFFIRKMCNQGQVKYYKSGNKSLVNYDSLIEFLKNMEGCDGKEKQ
jgi:hypothetical protein